ncbi:MAG: hypothetical protein OQL19_10270 [Gammaproteobacteria bacterium]|nr:hypothetical protein [Gammaproteobacteria bacterium]
MIKDIADSFKNNNQIIDYRIINAVADDNIVSVDELTEQELYFEEEKQQWSELSDSLIELTSENNVLAWMPVQSLKYYLPAFMIYSLSHYDKNNIVSDVTDQVFLSLHELLEKNITIDSLFDKKQILAVYNFVRFFIDCDFRLHNVVDIELAKKIFAQLSVIANIKLHYESILFVYTDSVSHDINKLIQFLSEKNTFLIKKSNEINDDILYEVNIITVINTDNESSLPIVEKINNFISNNKLKEHYLLIEIIPDGCSGSSKTQEWLNLTLAPNNFNDIDDILRKVIVSERR